MKLTLKEVFYLSRPRFWMYVFGTYLVGVISAGNLFKHDISTTLLLIAFGIFFSLPANVFIYGVNDIYDYETDRYNAKKIKYESVLKPEKQKSLWLIIIGLLLPFVLLFFMLGAPAKIAFGLFLFTGLFYSAAPIRAKAKPPLDILFSAIIYISPALVGYFITANTALQWPAVVGGLIWAFAMQTYSAIPDIEADKKAGVKTLAIQLGEQNALWFCLLAYLVAMAVGFAYLGAMALIGSVYIAMVLLSLNNRSQLFKYYTYFPLINVLTGALLFFYLFFKGL